MLLCVLILACVLGSIIPQGELQAYYIGYYPERLGWLILLTGTDDIFHSVWFVILTVFLCINLLGCNLIHFPRLLSRWKKEFTPERWMKRADQTEKRPIQKPIQECAAEISDEPLTNRIKSGPGLGKVFEELCIQTLPDDFFGRMGFRKIQKGMDAQEREYRYAVRNKIGIWGAWLTHLGMLIIVAGFSLGQMFTTTCSVYGVPGQTKKIEGTDYELTIDDFEILLRDDDTVEQYTASLTLTNTKTNEKKSGKASVNAPVTLFGMKLYQNSTGWAADTEVWKGEKRLQSELLCAGEHLVFVDNPDLVLAFNAFYPVYIKEENGAPATASPRLNNPAYLYTLYYQEGVVGMNVLMGNEKITVDDYFVFFYHPRPYTLIQIKRDPFTWLALLGGVVILAALILAFYVRTEELWAVQQADGTWTIYGRSPKGGALFQEKLLEHVSEYRKKPSVFRKNEEE